MIYILFLLICIFQFFYTSGGLLMQLNNHNSTKEVIWVPRPATSHPHVAFPNPGVWSAFSPCCQNGLYSVWSHRLCPPPVQACPLMLSEFVLSTSVKVKVAQSCPTLCSPMDYTVHGILQARVLEWVASCSLLQGIFPTQGSNPGLLHCRRILYQLSHKGSPC